MSDYKKQIEEFDNNFFSVIDKSARELSMTFDKLCFEKKGQDILALIKEAESLLDAKHNIPTEMQIYYDIANAYHDLRIIEGVDRECYLEKEIYHLKCVLDMYERNFMDDKSNTPEVKVAQYVAMRAYTNLGNAYQAIGRYIVAIDCFQNALLISNDFAMASLNLSLLLFRYADLQIKDYEQNYFHHACYYYYTQTENCKINLENQAYLEELKSYIALFDSTYIKKFLNKPLSLPTFHVDRQDEKDYRNYLLLFRLFLDPCLDISSDPCFAVDSLNLPFKKPYSDRQKEFIGLFNQIKQEYNWARFLWYKISTVEDYEHFSDKELDLVDAGDCADHSLKESMMRTAFKTCYSLFDRIGFFINEYFKVGLTGTKISFKNVWKDRLIDGRGNVYYSIPNPIITAHSDNLNVRAMYWLQKDFYEKKEINITTPHAVPIFKMRNDMEHNCLRTGKQLKNLSFTVYTTEGEIENNTFRLLKLAREIIIYLCLAIEFNERNNKDDEQSTQQN